MEVDDIFCGRDWLGWRGRAPFFFPPCFGFFGTFRGRRGFGELLISCPFLLRNAFDVGGSRFGTSFGRHTDVTGEDLGAAVSFP